MTIKRIAILFTALAAAAVTLWVTLLGLRASSSAYAMPANAPALATLAGGPTVIATVTVGTGPFEIGVNPTTNRVYVVNYGSGGGNTVSVIDGSNNTTVATVTVGSGPVGVGVNPNTNLVYASNYNSCSSSTVSVISGTSNTVVATATAGSGPTGIGVNPNTNLLYVANYCAGTVSVISGVSNTLVATLTVGSNPWGVGVNPNTNLIYVANRGGNTVSVIDGASNTLVATMTVGSGPSGVGVNPVANRVYVGGGAYVWRIDGASNTVAATTTVGSSPWSVGVNPTTNRIYASNYVRNYVWVLEDGVSLDKSVSPSSARPGEAITYTLAFINNGALIATHVVLTDIVPANVSVTGIVSAGVSITQTAGVSYAWQIQDLRPNDSGVITITGLLARPLAAGTIPNTATLSVSNTVQSASAPLTVQNVAPVADAGLDQSRHISNTVTLDGSGSTDDNGGALTYGWKQAAGPAVTFTPNLSVTTFTAPGAPTVLTFTLTVTDSGNLADTDQVVVNVVQEADLLVTENVLRVANAITYTIVAQSLGPDAANGAVVSSTFPAEVVSITWECVGSGGAACGASSGTAFLPPAINPFPSGGVVTYTVQGTLGLADSGNNVVTLTPPSGVVDPNLLNNQAEYRIYRYVLPLVFKNAP
jgi:uncharacterized repeat protein (TIGR01451 family)